MNRLMIISLNSDPILQYGTEHNGGQSKYIFELGKNLVRENWEIDVYTIQNSNNAPVQRITDGFNIYRFPLPDHQDYSYDVTESDIHHVTDLITAFIQQKGLRYHIVLCCYWLSGIAGLRLKKVLHKNTLITFCSLGHFKQQATGDNPRIKKRIEKEKYITTQIDHIIATSEEEKKILTDIYQAPVGKITVIPRGVDTYKFKKIHAL